MYEIFAELLKEKGVTPYQVHKATGVAQSSLSDWKNGKSTPKYDKMVLIAKYFGVSVDYLLGKTYTKKEPTVKTDDDELNEYLEELKNRPEMQMLFSLAKGASKEDVEKAVKIVEALFEK